MSKKVLVISTTLRAKGNSLALAEEFAKGAAAAGHDVEVVTLKDKTINFCKGCLACQESHQCVIKDDAPAIAEKMKEAEVIAFATPIYYYEMAGQMKTLLDRANPIFGSDYKFGDIYLLATAAEDAPTTIDGAVKGLEGWVACFSNATLKATVFAGGVTDTGDIAGNPALKDAYAAGKNA